MSQFDVYANTNKDTNKAYPYFVDVQNGLLDALNSRLVIPLTPVATTGKPYPDHLCPILKIAGESFALLTHQMASVPVSLLKKKECSLSEHRSDIISAIDFLVTGI